MPTLLVNQPQTSSNQLSTTSAVASPSISTPQCYQADQQVKYLHLQAEIDVLFQQLQALKQQKQSDTLVASR
jgi:hypothetical protein